MTPRISQEAIATIERVRRQSPRFFDWALHHQPERRGMFLDLFLEGKTQAEICEFLGVAPYCVYQHVHHFAHEIDDGWSRFKEFYGGRPARCPNAWRATYQPPAVTASRDLLMLRVSDLLRRTGVGDADLLVRELERRCA